LPVKFDAYSRERQQFKIFGPPLCEPLALAAHDIVLSGCEQVGLRTDLDNPDYSVWVFLGDRGFAGHIDHVWVDNESARLPTKAPDPCLVMCMGLSFPETMLNRFPHQSQYGPIQIFWSESASRGAELAQVTNRTQTARWLSRSAIRVEFEGQTITFGLRTLRAGHLRLGGLIKDSEGRPLDQGALRIATQSGFEQTRALTGRPISLAVPSTGGRCVIQVDLTASPSTSTALWDQFEWSWQPD